MSSNNREQIAEILAALKIGSILTKRKHDGEKYTHHYFLHEQENFISYRRSERMFTQPTRCK
jgi:hypothetical protein